MPVIVAGLLCVATGFVVTCLGWPQHVPSRSHFLLKSSLGMGFGVGVFSVVFFLLLLVSSVSFLAVDLAVFLVLLAALLWRQLRHRRELPTKLPQLMEVQSTSWIRPVVVSVFGLALICSLYASIVRLVSSPHGSGWDAFAIWNLHARFLFRGAAHWRDGFSLLIPWSHPDYPLLLPASSAHFWEILGHESPWVPAFIALMFAFGTVALLFSGLSILRGKNQACLGGTLLLATPFFVEQGASQYADVPVGFFFLATIVLFCLRDEAVDQSFAWLGLAGLAAAFAAWTKNEGLLFFAAVVIAHMLVPAHRARRVSLTHLVPMFLTALPVLLVIAYFKQRVAPPGDLFSGTADMFHKLLDPSRYLIILRWYGKELLRFGHWLLIPGTLLLAAYYFLVGHRRDAHNRTAIRTSALAMGLTLAGYAAIYVITPYDLYWHLRFSLDRLFLQVWPSVIFLFFMVVRTPEQALG
jgi:hypothetical protein